MKLLFELNSPSIIQRYSQGECEGLEGKLREVKQHPLVHSRVHELLFIIWKLISIKTLQNQQYNSLGLYFGRKKQYKTGFFKYSKIKFYFSWKTRRTVTWGSTAFTPESSRQTCTLTSAGSRSFILFSQNFSFVGIPHPYFFCLFYHLLLSV